MLFKENVFYCSNDEKTTLEYLCREYPHNFSLVPACVPEKNVLDTHTDRLAGNKMFLSKGFLPNDWKHNNEIGMFFGDRLATSVNTMILW